TFRRHPPIAPTIPELSGFCQTRVCFDPSGGDVLSCPNTMAGRSAPQAFNTSYRALVPSSLRIPACPTPRFLLPTSLLTAPSGTLHLIPYGGSVTKIGRAHV